MLFALHSYIKNSEPHSICVKHKRTHLSDLRANRETEHETGKQQPNRVGFMYMDGFAHKPTEREKHNEHCQQHTMALKPENAKRIVKSML